MQGHRPRDLHLARLATLVAVFALASAPAANGAKPDRSVLGPSQLAITEFSMDGLVTDDVCEELAG
jgi:hypothetical protein